MLPGMWPSAQWSDDSLRGNLVVARHRVTSPMMMVTQEGSSVGSILTAKWFLPSSFFLVGPSSRLLAFVSPNWKDQISSLHDFCLALRVQDTRHLQSSTILSMQSRIVSQEMFNRFCVVVVCFPCFS